MSAARMLLMAGKGGVGKTTVAQPPPSPRQAAACAPSWSAWTARTAWVTCCRRGWAGFAPRSVPRFTLGDGAGPAGRAAAPVEQSAMLSKAILPLSWRARRRGRGDGSPAGLEELLALARLADLLMSGRYDLIVADMAPTASSLRYLSFPDLASGPLKKWMALDHTVVRLLRPLQGRGLDVPLPEDAVYSSLTALADRLGTLRDLLADPSRAAVRLVMVPESVVLDETRRALAAMSLFGLNVDAIVVNRVLPEEATQGFLHTGTRCRPRCWGGPARASPTLPGCPWPGNRLRCSAFRHWPGLRRHSMARAIPAPSSGSSHRCSGARRQMAAPCFALPCRSRARRSARPAASRAGIDRERGWLATGHPAARIPGRPASQGASHRWNAVHQVRDDGLGVVTWPR